MPISRSFRRAVEQAIASLFVGATGHNHDGTDGNGQRILGGNVDATWLNWTPTITQSTAITVTVNEAKYCIIGKVCHIYAHITCTSAGTATNPVVISGVPSAAQVAFTNAIALIVGTARVYDKGTGNYLGALVAYAADTFRMYTDTKNNWLGADPAYTIANGDVIAFTATYRIA